MAVGGFATQLLFSIYNYSIRTANNKIFVIWDTFTSVTTDLEVDVPQKPLENGRFSTDSKIRKPEIITIEAIKSHPFLIYKDIEKLRNAVKSPELFKISTRYQNYKNYTLQSFSFTLDDKNATRLSASMVFSEVIIIEPEYVKLSASNVKNPQSSSIVDSGKKELKAEKNSSILFKLSQKIGG